MTASSPRATPASTSRSACAFERSYGGMRGDEVSARVSSMATSCGSGESAWIEQKCTRRAHARLLARGDDVARAVDVDGVHGRFVAGHD